MKTKAISIVVLFLMPSILLNSRNCTQNGDRVINQRPQCDIGKPILSSFVKICDGKTTYGLADENYDVVFSAIYVDIIPFSKLGIILLQDANGNWGCVDVKGKIIAPFNYEEINVGCHFDKDKDAWVGDELTCFKDDDTVDTFAYTAVDMPWRP